MCRYLSLLVCVCVTLHTIFVLITAVKGRIDVSDCAATTTQSHMHSGLFTPRSHHTATRRPPGVVEAIKLIFFAEAKQAFY